MVVVVDVDVVDVVVVAADCFSVGPKFVPIDLFAADDIDATDRRSSLELARESMANIVVHRGQLAVDARAKNADPDTFHCMFCMCALTDRWI